MSRWSISLEPLEDREALAAAWRELEARSDAEFFLSSTWILSWLETINVRPLVLTVRQLGCMIALGLFVTTRRRRHLIVNPLQLCLNETGQSEIDDIAIEHNGFLMDREAPEEMVAAVFAQLRELDVPCDWNELVIGGVSQAMTRAAEKAGLGIEIDRRKTCYAIDLQQLRAENKSLLDVVSANTRSQIRRACRLAEEDGALTIRQAADLSEAHLFFERLKHLHTAQWQGRGKAGAFSTPFQREFHRKLIVRGFPQGQIELLRVTAGEAELGYLYNFVYRNRAYNYQSGFRRRDDNRDRPGLVAHYLCCERAKTLGIDSYDLLAGDQRYKRSIGQPSAELFWCRAQKSGPVLAAERLARRVKRRLLGSFARSSESAA